MLVIAATRITRWCNDFFLITKCYQRILVSACYKYNISAVTALWARDEGIPLRLQLLIYPAVDSSGDYPSRVENATGYLLDQESMEWFTEHYFGPVADRDDWRAAPMRALRHDGVAPAGPGMVSTICSLAPGLRSRR